MKLFLQRPDLRQTKYNQAEIVLHEMAEKELEFFIPSQIANENPETDRVILINHLSNGGVGAAIARGYKWCIDHHIDCTAVMAGDGQMDPSELESICRPVIEDGIDYVKGNRLIHRSAWLVMPKIRYVGNAILSILTKIASGYWHVSDTQCGFTAISLKALQSIKIHNIYRSYGMPNDLMVKLNIAFCTIKEVGIKAHIQYRRTVKNEGHEGYTDGILAPIQIFLSNDYGSSIFSRIFIRFSSCIIFLLCLALSQFPI